MVRFVHSADWQLGMTRHFLNDEAQPRFSAARLDAIASIGRLARDEDCEFVLVCGDVFESNHVERRILARCLEKMAAVAEVGFFLLPGNHDPLDASSIFLSPAFKDHKPDNVTVLDGSEPVQAAAGVELIAAPWRNKHPSVDLLGAACENLDATDSLRILVGHGAVDSMSPNRGDPKLISLARLEAAIEAGRAHYAALGDRHSTTCVGSTGRIWYSGAPEPTDFTETDPGKALVVDLSTDGARVAKRSVGTWHFVRRDLELCADEDLDSLEGWLSELPDKDRTIVRLSITGELSVSQKVRFDSVIEHHSELLAALQDLRGTAGLMVVADDDDLSRLALSGFAKEALEDLSALAVADETRDGQTRAATAHDALTLLYRLVRSSE